MANLKEPKPRGRPRKAVTLTPAERTRRHREKKRYLLNEGLDPITIIAGLQAELAEARAHIAVLNRRLIAANLGLDASDALEVRDERYARSKAYG